MSSSYCYWYDNEVNRSSLSEFSGSLWVAFPMSARSVEIHFSNNEIELARPRHLRGNLDPRLCLGRDSKQLHLMKYPIKPLRNPHDII